MKRIRTYLSKYWRGFSGGTSRVLEKVIGETLFAKMGLSPEGREDYDFRSLVRIARAKFLSSSRSRSPAV